MAVVWGSKSFSPRPSSPSSICQRRSTHYEGKLSSGGKQGGVLLHSAATQKGSDRSSHQVVQGMVAMYFVAQGPASSNGHIVSCVLNQPSASFQCHTNKFCYFSFHFVGDRGPRLFILSPDFTFGNTVNKHNFEAIAIKHLWTCNKN